MNYSFTLRNPTEISLRHSFQTRDRVFKRFTRLFVHSCVLFCVVFSSDSTGNVIDLVKDQLPELQLSEEDRQKNLELLEQAKKVSDRFLTRRGRRSTSSLNDSPTGEHTLGLLSVLRITGCLPLYLF